MKGYIDVRDKVAGGLAPIPCTAGPRLYAQRLASYIRDPSTIRARTMDEYGRAPSIEDIKLFQARAGKVAEVVRYAAECNSPAENEDPGLWATPGLVRLAAERRAIQQRAQMTQAAARLDQAREVPATRNVATARDVLRLIAQAHGLTSADVTGSCRLRTVVPVRHMAAWILVHRGRLSRTQIGRLLGGRDHSTVINSVKVFEATATPEQRELALRIVNWCNEECETPNAAETDEPAAEGSAA